MPVLEQEFRMIDGMLRQRHDAARFRVTWSSAMIEVFQRHSFDVADMLATFGGDPGDDPGGPLRSGSIPWLRFMVASEQPRRFRVERWSGDAWQMLAEQAPFAALASYVQAPEYVRRIRGKEDT